MKVLVTDIPDVRIVEPRVSGDARGFLYESYNARDFAEQAGIPQRFVQDNHSRSARGVLRGLHYQVQQAQGKLVRVIAGEIFDVAVDCRRSSASFGRHVATRLSADNRRILWIPEGFAHGFVVLSEYAEVCYKTTDFWAAQHERCIAWNDPDLAIPWPLD
ncbi:MAG: dTDP-4-dehydrorhamnose 3,5-epimerase, partial [Betaproteobacteria bacterium]